MHTLRRRRSTFPRPSGIRPGIGRENFVTTSENYLGKSHKPEMGMSAVFCTQLEKLVLAISPSALISYPYL